MKSKVSPGKTAIGKKTPGQKTPPAAGGGAGVGDDMPPPPPATTTTTTAATPDGAAGASAIPTPPPPEGAAAASGGAAAADGAKGPATVPGKKTKTPIGKGKLPPGKGKALPSGKKSPTADPDGTSTSPVAPPPADGQSPSPPPPPRDDSPSPPPPARDGDNVDGGTPPPPPPPDDSTPRAGADASPSPPAGTPGKAPATEPPLGAGKHRRLTAAQEAAEQEKLRIAEEQRKDREQKAAIARALMSAPPPVFSVKLLIGADSTLLPNWAELKMMVEVPMTQPCRPYLEKIVLAKTGWESMEGKTFYRALGTTPKTLKRSNEVFQTNMTPMQLHMDPGVHYVWLNRALPDEEPVFSSASYFKARLERYYEFYENNPEEQVKKMASVDSVLYDFKGHEHVMMLKLRQRYGIEPTNEMILRKRAWIQRQKEILDAAELQAARGTYNTNSVKTLSKRELRLLIGVLERDAKQRTRFEFFKKWERYQSQQKMNALLINFLHKNIVRFQRSNFYWKLKSHGNIRLYRGHLHVASQIAIKSHSLLGEMAEENKALKEDIRKKLASIDVLENANTKRLETLYASAETAVHELRVMAGEVRRKEREVAALEQKLLHLGGEYVDAIEAKEAAIKRAAQRQIEFERDEVGAQAKLKEMTLQHGELVKHLDTLYLAAGKKGDDECPHCEHFPDASTFLQSQTSNLAKLKQRVADVDKIQRDLQSELNRLARDDSDATAPPLPTAGDDAHPTSPTGLEGSQSREQRDGSTSATVDAANASPGSESLAIAGAARSVSLAKPMTAMQRLALLRSSSNYSGSGGARGISASSARQPQQQQRSGTAGAAQDDPDMQKIVRESELFRAASIEPSVLAKISKRSGVEKADLSMSEWFTTDELIAVDRVRISLDRQTAHRKLEEIAALIAKDPHSEALLNMQREHILAAARQAALQALSPQQKQRRENHNQQMMDAFAHDEKYTRPPPVTNHGRYATLPLTSSSGRMLDTIFRK